MSISILLKECSREGASCYFCRNELSALCSEVSKLRAAMNAGVEVCAAEGLSDGNMRALAGTDRLTVNKGKGITLLDFKCV